LSQEALWGQDLTEVPGLCEKVTEYLVRLETEKTEEIVWKLSGLSE